MIRSTGETVDASPAQTALAWLLAQKPWIVPIPGTTKLHRLEENLGALDVHFSDEQLDALTAAADHVQIMGDRMPPGFLEQTGR